MSQHQQLGTSECSVHELNPDLPPRETRWSGVCKQNDDSFHFAYCPQMSEVNTLGKNDDDPRASLQIVDGLIDWWALSLKAR